MSNQLHIQKNLNALEKNLIPVIPDKKISHAFGRKISFRDIESGFQKVVHLFKTLIKGSPELKTRQERGLDQLNTQLSIIEKKIELVKKSVHKPPLVTKEEKKETRKIFTTIRKHLEQADKICKLVERQKNIDTKKSREIIKKAMNECDKELTDWDLRVKLKRHPQISIAETRKAYSIDRGCKHQLHIYRNEMKNAFIDILHEIPQKIKAKSEGKDTLGKIDKSFNKFDDLNYPYWDVFNDVGFLIEQIYRNAKKPIPEKLFSQVDPDSKIGKKIDKYQDAMGWNQILHGIIIPK